MYYSDQENPYLNYPLNQYTRANLPMEEFSRGNFSQAQKIGDVYRKYIQDCLQTCTSQYTNGKGDVGAYLQELLSMLEKKHKERTEKKEQAIKDMKNIQKQINDEKQAFRDEGKGEKLRNTFFDYLEKNDFDIYVLERAFEASKESAPEKYERAKSRFRAFITSAQIRGEKIEELALQHFRSKEQRNKATHELSHESNRQNLEQRIDDIKTGKTRERIAGDIQEEILKIFRKTDHIGELVDTRSLEEMFTSILATTLITNPQTDKQLKKTLIKNHTDKWGLFNHIWNLYNKDSLFGLELHTGRFAHTRDSRNTTREDAIISLAHTAKKILHTLRAGSYFWMADCSPEEMDSMGQEDRKTHVIQDLVSHLEKTLQEPDKKDTRRKESDKKLQKLFDGIYSIMEDHAFENFCEQLHNLDVGKYRQILGAEGKMLMKRIFASMTEDERKLIKKDHDTWTSFTQIEQEVCAQEKKEQKKQLLIFDFPPIYHLQGYVESVIPSIEALIGNLSYRQKRLCESVVWSVLENRGFKNHIEVSETLPPLSDEEFLDILKNAKHGKSLSLKIKKTGGKFLPDINAWIHTMQQVQNK